MKILVSGGAGFIGSNIVDAYIDKGHDVAIIDNLSTGKKENINKRARFYHADVTDRKKIDWIFARERPEIVSHHAAQIDVRKSVSDPAFDTKVNILGIISVGENCIRNGVAKMIFSSSGGVMYGECSKPAKEKDFKPPISPYGISKFASEMYLSYWKEVYGLKYTSLRYSNVYGPRQAGGDAGAVSIFISSFLDGKRARIFGDGKQTRDYVYVGDVVEANVRALDRGDNQQINIGTRKSVSLNELYNIVQKEFGSDTGPEYAPPRAGELLRSILDNSKAKKLLGWNPKTSLREGIINTIAWFREHA